jgi:uncharacterized protein YdeI (YjbR/CyaY-like superfamily)
MFSGINSLFPLAKEDKMEPLFFATTAELRAWFEANHDKLQEQWIGYYKKDSGKPSITWQESVDVALCFGWIDGVRKSIDKESYTNRFTPRRKGSNWSDINIKRVQELTEMGLMHPNGLKAFEARKETNSVVYSYEQRDNSEFDAESLALFQANEVAWAYFQNAAPSYQKAAIWWVISAKQPETRQRRLSQLIEDSAAGRPVPPLTPRRAKWTK